MCACGCRKRWRERTLGAATIEPALITLQRRAERLLSALHLDEADLVDQAVGQHRLTADRDVHVAYDVAAAGDRPGLEFFASGIEAHDGVRLGRRLAVPDRALGEDHAIGLRLRPARRQPFLHRAISRIEAAEIAARKIAVPDD